MKRKRLNLSALRTRALPMAPEPTQAEELLANSSFTLSRREMLGIMGVASTAPLLSPAGSTLLGSFRIDSSRQRISFWMRGKERWVVDANAFDGTPRVSLRNGERKTIVVQLKDALFPGTDVQASFVATLVPGLSGWRMSFSSELGFDGEVPFESWLMGRRSLVSTVTVSEVFGTSLLNPIVRLRGKTRVAFAPDWTLRFSGREIATVKAPGIDVVSSQITLHLPVTGADSLFASVPKRRSLLAIEKGDADWDITPDLHRQQEWQFRAVPNAFDRLLIEATGPAQRASAARRSFALCAECTDSRRHNVSVLPASCCSSFGGDPFEIPLADVRYAVTINSGGRHSAVASGYLLGAGWMRTKDFSLKVGKFEDDGATFCISASGGTIDSIDCTLSVEATMLHPDDPNVIVRPVPLAEPTTLKISTGRRKRTVNGNRKQASKRTDIGISERSGDPSGDELFLRRTRTGVHPELTMAVAPVELIRPEDLAVIRFEFHNMTVDSSGDNRRVRSDGTGTAYLVAQFPPQHITEQALFEATPDLKVSDEIAVSGVNAAAAAKSSTAKSEGGSDSPSSFPPPVAALMAGPSRLVFVVPPAMSIPFTMEGLLQACSELDMSLALNAKPPPDNRVLAISDHILDTMLAKDITTINTDAMGVSGVSMWSTLRIDAAATTNVQRRRFQTNANARTLATSQFARTADVNIAQLRSTAVESKPKDLIRNYRNQRLAETSSIGLMLGANKAQIDLSKSASIGPRITELIARPTLPTATTTAIEAPYRLIMSPNRFNAWAHSAAPVASLDGTVELWHTRIGVRKGNGGVYEGPNRNRTMRAIWSPDYVENSLGGPTASNEPFRMALDGSDRHNLVHLTSNFTLPDWTPRAVGVKQFMLSSLGAWIDLRGDFGPRGSDLPNGLAVLEWVHRGTMARDHYVKVVYAGYLFPWGHQASLIKITERKFAPHPTTANAQIAYLFQRMYIVVREPVKVLPFDRGNPIKSAHILTLNTPNLDKPEASDYPETGTGHLQGLFWPRVQDADFLFNMRLEDVEGGTHEVTMPLAFVRKDEVDKYIAGTDLTLDTLINDYEADHQSPGTQYKRSRRTRSLDGQTVAFADSTVPGDTAFETDTVTFGAAPLKTIHPGFEPRFRMATVVVPAIKQLTGDASSVAVKYYDRYLNSGFAATGPNKNTGEIFLSLITDTADDDLVFESTGAVAQLDVNFSSQGDRSGGLVQPNLRVQGLSRKKGPVSGRDKAALNSFADGSFNPAAYFGAPGSPSATSPELPEGLLPKLFGVIDLWDIIAATGIDGPTAPTFITETLGVVENFLAAFDTFRSLAQSGLNAATALQTNVQAIQSDFLLIEADFEAVVNGSFPGAFATHLGQLATHVGNVLGALPGAGLDSGLRQQTEKVLRQFETTLADINDFVVMAQAFATALEAIQQKKIRLEWKPTLKPFSIPGASNPIFSNKSLKGNKPASLTLAVEMMAEGGNAGSAPSLDVYCALENFTLNLVPVPGGAGANLFTYIMSLGFDRVSFFAGSATKPGVDVVMSDIEFKGILGFVETLRSLIPLDGFSDPPFIEVDSSGIRAGFDVEIPAVAVGVFSLQNLSLGAELKIPFIGESLEISFNFSRPENPALLSVWVFGGAAYLGVTITPRGLRSIRAAFEFGATVSLNFGVASGSVYIMAGVYFEYVIAQKETEEDSMTLIGYLRLGGYVRVLGIISLSIEMKMEIGYENGKAIGRATIQVEVEVLLFSATVSIKYEKKFAGANNDPTFKQMMTEPYLEPVQNAMVVPWTAYVSAFA